MTREKSIPVGSDARRAILRDWFDDPSVILVSLPVFLPVSDGDIDYAPRPQFSGRKRGYARASTWERKHR